MRTNRFVAFLFAGLIWLVSGVSAATGVMVEMPMSIDYPLLQALVVQTAYRDENRTALLVDEAEGCRRIVLSQPRLRAGGDHILLESLVSLRMGVQLAGSCLAPVEWEGWVELKQTPVIDANWVLSFATRDSRVLTKARQPARLAGMIWKHVRDHVYSYLEGITINLAPPISELKLFLEPLFPQEQRDRVQSLLSSMHPGSAVVAPDALRIDVMAEVAELYASETDRQWERLTEMERRNLIHSWELWDAYLVLLINNLAGKPLSLEERLLVLDTLLESRYGFVAGLTDPNLSSDFVRVQFVNAWQAMAPVFRNHLVDENSLSLLSFLALFTASDALIALDAIGPTLGIEISRNGLVRLARLLQQGEDIPLSYGGDMDLQLRSVLGLGPLLRLQDLNSHFPNADAEALFGVFKGLFVTPAMAAEEPDRDYLHTWLPPREKPDRYIDRIIGLLEDAVPLILARGKIPTPHHDMFRHLTIATAWQESCFRQFREKGGRIEFLVSYNGSSVGLMQINERVWRGIYDVESLRWDIRYNALAGCEILELYLNRYALRHIANGNFPLKMTPQLLARIVYAMYNGGPNQFRKFLARHRNGDYYISDKLFYEKHAWVLDGQWDKMRVCLVGG